MKQFLQDFFGYDSLPDILHATIAYKHKLSTIYAFSITLGAALAALATWVDAYIYTPALGMFVLWGCSLLDTILGASVAIEAGEGLRPGKLLRAVIRVVVQSLIVALFFHMGRAWPLFIYYWMVDALLALFTLSVFYSIIQNSYKLGLIEEDSYKHIENIVNIKKLMEKIKRHK